MSKEEIKLCSEPDCYEETDLEINVKGEIYPRSLKCWDCRTKQDRDAIKRWRKKERKKVGSKPELNKGEL